MKHQGKMDLTVVQLFGNFVGLHSYYCTHLYRTLFAVNDRNHITEQYSFIDSLNKNCRCGNRSTEVFKYSMKEGYTEIIIIIAL